MSMNDKETLYAFKYADWSIEYSFGKIRNQANKEIYRILMEEMTLERRRALEALNAETTYDIVACLIDQNWFSNDNTYKL